MGPSKKALQMALGLLQSPFRVSGGIGSFILYDTASVGFYDECLNGSSRIKRISRILRREAQLQLYCNCYYHKGTEAQRHRGQKKLPTPVVTRPRPFPKSLEASIVFETAPASVGSDPECAVFKTPFRPDPLDPRGSV